MPVVTWSTTDKVGTTTPSGVTVTKSGNGARGRATYGRLTGYGKWYWETVVTVSNTGSTVGLGLIPSDFSLADINAYYGSSATSIGVFDDRVYYNAGSPTALVNIAGNGAHLRTAWDAAANLIWFSKNGGDWNGSPTANPATGVGGFDISPTGGKTMLPAWAFDYNGTTPTASITSNFGASAFTYTPPTGFYSYAQQVGSATISEDPDNATSNGKVAIKGVGAVQEAGDTTASSGQSVLVATGSITEASDTVTSTRLWSPSDSPNSTEEIDFSLASSLSLTGSDINTVTSTIGTGVYTSSATKPTLVAAALNGRSVGNFGGSAYMTGDAVSRAITNGKTRFSVVALYKPAVHVTLGAVYSASTGTDATKTRVSLREGTAGTPTPLSGAARRLDAQSTNTEATGGSLVVGSWHVVTVQIDTVAGTLQARLNGLQVGATVAIEGTGPISATDALAVAIGRDSTGALLNGQIGQIDSGAFTDSEVYKVEGSMAWKWQQVPLLDPTHPYSAHSPQIGVAVGSLTEASDTAAGTSAAYSFVGLVQEANDTVTATARFIVKGVGIVNEVGDTLVALGAFLAPNIVSQAVLQEADDTMQGVGNHVSANIAPRVVLIVPRGSRVTVGLTSRRRIDVSQPNIPAPLPLITATGVLSESGDAAISTAAVYDPQTPPAIAAIILPNGNRLALAQGGLIINPAGTPVLLVGVPLLTSVVGSDTIILDRAGFTGRATIQNLAA